MMKTHKVQVILAAAVLAANVVVAGNVDWKSGVTSGILDDADNWSSAAKPDSSSDIRFTSSDTIAAGLTNNLQVNSFYLIDSHLTLALGTNALTVASTGKVVGPSATDKSTTLSLTSGKLIGLGAWSFGTEKATPTTTFVTGKDTLLQVNGGDMANGGSGHQLTVSNGGRFLTTANFCVGNYGDNSVLIAEGTGTVVAAKINAARLNIGGTNRSGNKIIVRKGARLEVPSGNYTYMEVGCGGTNGQKAHHNELILQDGGTTGVIGQLTLSTWAKSNTISVLNGACLLVTNSFGASSRNTAVGNRFVISNAVFEACKRDGASGRADGTVDHGTDFIITGPQARARFDQFNAKNHSNLYILDGAVVTNAQYWGFGNNEAGCCHLIVSNATLNSGYNINAGNYTTNCSIKVLAGGKINNPTLFFDIGSQASGHDDYMIIDGEGSFASASRFRLGGNSSYCWTRISNGGELRTSSCEIGGTTSAVSNRLEVVDGGLLKCTSDTTIWFGRNSPGATNSILLVRNGAVDASSGNGNLNMRGAGVLRLEGTNTVVKVNYFQTKESSVIEFKPPEDASVVDAAYVQLKQWVVSHTDSTTKFKVVEAKQCMRHGGGVYTLMTCENNDIQDFPFASVELPEGGKLIREARAIKVKIPSSLGLTVIFR